MVDKKRRMLVEVRFVSSHKAWRAGDVARVTRAHAGLLDAIKVAVRLYPTHDCRSKRRITPATEGA
jgi:hypothetical protein